MIKQWRGYCKTPANGRKGLLRELVYHSLAKKVIPGIHPHIGLIETPIDATESSYELFIESVGDNVNLLQHCKDLSKNSEQMAGSRLNNLGCSLAFSVLILSADNFMKNFVVIYTGNRQGFVYPIDFELLDRSKMRSLEIEYIDTSKSPKPGMRAFIEYGALLDYKTIFSANEHFRGATGAENASEVGQGLSVFGDFSRDIYQFIIQNAAEDIGNGNILAMYKRVAALSHSDIDQLMNRLSFIMTDTEMQEYRHDLLQIVEKTQEYLSKNDQGPRLGL